ncbi:ROK family protein [Acidisoma cellulosilytica]|uniref:ROK family protein n=1 Tax=Acidisoma cellulosilyticum TaxID=2802395 RepID=A0A964E4C3_9PROT|nr:ROK family protein [Acidisoma cellulosilyticum]MCB8881324.1 ROK family protein [Acidisoma cellulosilyticum]
MPKTPEGREAPSTHAGQGRRGDSERYSLVAVMELIRSGRADTRLEIERLSGLGRAVVTDRLTALIDLGLVEEGELGPAIGGRAPRRVKFRADAGRILVATLDSTTIGVGLADLAGRLRVEHYEAIDAAQGPAASLKRLDTLFDWMLDQYPEARDVWAIGLGTPVSLFNLDASGLNLDALDSAIATDKAPLTENLVARYRAPVWVRSLVQLMTIGEFGVRNEAGMSNRDFLYVDLGDEITAGLMSDGRLHRGAHGIAGQIGHIATDSSREVCRCGNIGCLELVAGAGAIVGEALQAAQDGRSRYLAEVLAANGQLALADIGFSARLGDPYCAELLSRCGQLIGKVLAGLANALNPAVIVLGGELARTGDILLAAIRETIYRHTAPVVTRDLQIIRSQMGRSAGLIGAGLLTVDALFASDRLGGWITTGTPLQHPDVQALLARVTQSRRMPPPPDPSPDR